MAGKKLRRSKVFSFSVIYEPAVEGGYVVSAPSLPGCRTQGETLMEAEQNIKEAIAAYLESLIKMRRPVSSDVGVLQGKVEVAV